MDKPVVPVAEKELFNKVKIGKSSYDYRQSLVIPLPGQFVDILKLIEAQHSEANFEFDQEGFTIDLFDPANVSRGILRVKKPFFREYNFGKGNHGVNVHFMSQALEGFPDDVPVKVHLLPTGFKLAFVGKTPKSQRSFIIPLIEIEKKENKPITPKKEVSVNISLKALVTGIKEISTKVKAADEEAKGKYNKMFSGASLKIITEKPDKISFIIHTNEKPNIAEVKYVIGKTASGEIKENIVNHYSYEFIKKVVLAADKVFGGSSVTINTGKNHLLEMVFGLENINYTWYLAPRDVQ